MFHERSYLPGWSPFSLFLFNFPPSPYSQMHPMKVQSFMRKHRPLLAVCFTITKATKRACSLLLFPCLLHKAFSQFFGSLLQGPQPQPAAMKEKPLSSAVAHRKLHKKSRSFYLSFFCSLFFSFQIKAPIPPSKLPWPYLPKPIVQNFFFFSSRYWIITCIPASAVD